MAELFIAFMFGMGLGVAIMYKVFEHYTYNPVGTLRIDHSFPDEPPSMFLEINSGAGDISKRESVCLRVVNKNYLDSHE